MMIPLADEQAAQLLPMMKTGVVLLGRITREAYDAEKGNVATAGRLLLEAGAVPEYCLPNLREAIRTAVNPAQVRGKKAKVRRGPSELVAGENEDSRSSQTEA